MGVMGDSLGPYRILRRLGVGGMAETFEALRVDPNGFEQRVCLKRVLPAFRDDPSFVQRFEREARIAARLRHSNVVGVLDFGAEDGVPYMALELVDGKDLRSFLGELPSGRLPPEVALLVVSDIAMALAYAHAPLDPSGDAGGLVHRDVTTSNILLGRAGEVKLADFGIAKVKNGVEATTSGEVRGKIPYMSPEQMRGQPVDGRADLFSLGVVLFELLTGVRPFDGSHDVETMTRIVANERRAIDALAPELPSEVVAIVDRLLEPPPERRFPDAAALLLALEAAGVDPKSRRWLAAEVERRVGGSGAREHLLARVGAPDAEAATAVPRVRAPAPRPPDPTTVVPPSIAAEERTVEAVARPNADEAATISSARSAMPSAPRPRGGRLGFAALAVALAIAGLGTGLLLGRGAPAPSETPAPERAAPLAAAPAADPATGAAREILTEAIPAPSPSVARAPERSPDPAPTPSIADAAAAPEAHAEASDAPDEPHRSETGRVRVTVVPWGRVWIDHRPAGRAPRTLSTSPGDHVVQAGFEHPMRTRRVRVRSGRTLSVEFELE
jgi:hypothetical protein